MSGEDREEISQILDGNAGEDSVIRLVGGRWSVLVNKSAGVPLRQSGNLALFDVFVPSLWQSIVGSLWEHQLCNPTFCSLPQCTGTQKWT